MERSEAPRDPILEAIVTGVVAWSSMEEIIRVVGQAEDEIALRLEALLVEGWIEAWNRDGSRFYTLTPWSSSRLGVGLEAAGSADEPRWRSSVPKASWRRGRRAALVQISFAEAVDPGSVPVAGQPGRLIGSDRVGWPGPLVSNRAGCPICDGIVIPPGGYCIYCDRTAEEARAARRSSYRRVSDPSDQRAKRRARRAERFKSKESRRSDAGAGM